MALIPRFLAYAAAFEKAYASDDWSLVEPFFTDDAEYEVGVGPPFTPDSGSCIRGRDAILAHFKRILDRFDRRFATREVEVLEGPSQDGDAVRVYGRGRYTTPHAPELVFELEEIAHFEGERIRRLEDRYPDADRDAMLAYYEAHGAKLGLEAS